MSDMLTELGRAVRRTAWVVPLYGRSGIVLPWTAGPPCIASSPDGFACTRKAGHGARHAACGYGGDLLAVWPQEVEEPCS